MNVEEKILRYLHSKFPRPIVFGFSGISIEIFGLNPDTDPLEFDRTFDLLKEQYFIAQNKGIITITFAGICYFEEKYLKPNYHYLKIFKTILESLERLENGEYPDNMISNKEIIKSLEMDGIQILNKDLYSIIGNLTERNYG